jgi:sulfide:quinone oxidoreductase
MSNGQTVLILGGGVGGIATANRLRQRLDRRHRVVVVERSPDHVFAPSLLWLMTGQRRPEDITRPLRQFLDTGIEVVVAEVQGISPDDKTVRTSAGDLAYDYLVVALGAELNPEGLPGFSIAAHSFFQLEGARALWSALQAFEGGQVVVLVASMPYKCPAAPYEAALLLDDALRRRGLSGKYQVDVYTPEPLPMPVAGPLMGQAVVGMLSAKGIGFHPGTQVAAIDPDARELVFGAGPRLGFDLLAGVAPHQAPRMIRESPLAGEAGWIPVDKHTLRTNQADVYAIGDVTAIRLANGKLLPKAGVFAHGEGMTVAAHIAATIAGTTSEARFDGLGYCWIEAGDSSAGFASGDFYAEPDPAVGLPRSGLAWHWGKVLFEQYWLGTGARRSLARWGLKAGGRFAGIPAEHGRWL